MNELAQIVSQFGVSALWAIVLYKLLDFLGIIGVFFFLGWGVKKAWPAIKTMLEQ